MSRRQTSQPAPSASDKRSTSTLSASQLVAWVAVALSLAAGAAFLFYDDGLGSRGSERARDDQDRPTAAQTQALSAQGVPHAIASAVGSVSWPAWGDQGSEDGDAGALETGDPQEFGAEVVVPVIPPPGEAPKRARDTGLQFSSDGDPALQAPKAPQQEQPARAPAANVAQPVLAPSVAGEMAPATLPVAVHERTAAEQPPATRPRRPDTGLVFSDSPAPLPNKR